MASELNPTSAELLLQLEEAYRTFRTTIVTIVPKGSFGTQMGESLASWFGMGKTRAHRELVCNAFADEVQRIVQALTQLLPTMDAEQGEALCRAVTEIMLITVSPDSNTSEDLMLRAMTTRLQQLFPYCARDTVEKILDAVQRAYKPRMMFPNERELIKSAQKLLKQ